jgi:hypothetical protein
MPAVFRHQRFVSALQECLQQGCGRALNRHGQCEAWTPKSLLADNAERFARIGNKTRRILPETFRFWLQGTKCPAQDNFNSLLDSLKPRLDAEPFRTRHQAAFAELIAAYDDWKSRRSEPHPLPAGTAMPRPRRLAAWSLDEDFARVLQKHSLFCGRRRLLDAIAEWHDREAAKYRAGLPPRPMLLLTGDPGIGKSALMAQFARNPPRGFVISCQFCDHTVAETLKPGRFVLHLAAALEENRSLEPYRAQICRATAALSADTIERYVDESEEDPRTLFNRFFRLPLQNAHPPQFGWIIIDGLDEALEIAGGRGPVRSIVHLLARELAALPDWVRVIATCRREVPEIRGAAGAPGGRIELLSIDDYWEEQDARDYIARRVTGHASRPLPGPMIKNLISETAGNFLLLSLILDKFLDSGGAAIDSDGMPNDLAAFYAQDFERRFPPRTEHWHRFETVVRPLLAVAMAVEESSISADFLRRSTGLEQRRLVPALREIRDYFPLRDGRYRVFHKSFFDWLRGPLAGDYYTDAAAGHKQLAVFCADVFARLEKEWPIRIENNDAVKPYVLSHGVTHLVRAGYFAEAIHVLDFIVREVTPRAQRLLPLATAARLRSPAAAMRIILLAFEACDEADPFTFSLDVFGDFAGNRQDGWRPLCRLLRLFYQVEPLHNIIQMLFRRYYPDEWPDILEDLLGAGNYVLTHEIAMVLGDACSGAKLPIAAIHEYLADPTDIGRFELGGYALRRYLGREPQEIGKSNHHLELLANCPVYVGPSILGDIVLNRVLQDRRFAAEIGGGAPRLFRDRAALWDHLRQSIWYIDAAVWWRTGAEPPTIADAGLRAAYEQLVATECLRRRLCVDGAVAREPAIAALVEGNAYWSLGNDPDPISDARSALGSLPLPFLQEVIGLLFAHPLWEVGETAASVFSSITIEAPATLEILWELLDKSRGRHWRLRLGAIEAAYCRPHLEPEARDDPFLRAVADFFDDAHSSVRALCAENLVAMIIEQAAAARTLLLERFHDEIQYWFNEERDCWVLEHLFRLRKALEASCDWEALFPLRPSSLFAGLRRWSDRGLFLAHIERRAIEAAGGHFPA